MWMRLPPRAAGAREILTHRRSAGAITEHVEGASGGVPQVPDDVRVDHRRLDLDVAEVVLDLPDVDAAPLARVTPRLDREPCTT